MNGLGKRIEEVLASYKRPVSVIEVRDAPQVILARLALKHRELVNGGRGDRTKIVHLRNLSAELAAELGAKRVCVVSREDGVWVEISKGDPSLVLAREVEVEKGKHRLPLALGISTKGTSLVVDLAEAPQILVAGTTGSGKSMLLHGCVYSLIQHTHPDKTRVVLVDTHSHEATPHTSYSVKEDGLGVWEGSPHVEQVVTSTEEALGALQAASRLIDRRYASGTRWSTRWVFVVDELASLLLCKTWGDEIHRVLVDILAAGRKAGVHVIAATQRPSHEITKGILKANFPVRICMAVASAVDSKVAMDARGGEDLGGKGDGILKVGMETTRFQGGLVTDSDVERVREWGSLWREKKGETGDNPKRGSPMKLDWLDEMKRLAEEGQRRVERWKS